MKKINYLKEALLLVTFVTTTLLITSCGYNQKPKDSKDVAEKHNEARFEDNKQEKDAQFLVNAAEMNLKQIQLGQLAQQKGSTAQVKELGKKMEDAHTKSHRELTALAQSKGIIIPTTATDNVRDAYEDLNDKTGNDFDKAYVDRMVSKHKDAISAFENATTDRYDSDIKNWAIATLPVLRTHLNLLTDFQDNYNKKSN